MQAAYGVAAMTAALIPASISQSRTIVLAGFLIATIAMILSGCGTPVATTDAATVTPPVTQPRLPADWPEEVQTPQGFTLEFAVGGSEDGRSDFTAQFVTFGNQVDEVDEYVASLISSGFALTEQREDLGIWILKGFGFRVEIVLDATYPNLTWLAVSVFTS